MKAWLSEKFGMFCFGAGVFFLKRCFTRVIVHAPGCDESEDATVKAVIFATDDEVSDKFLKRLDMAMK